MLTKDISTDINELETEIELLRKEFQQKVRVIEKKVTTLKKQLPKSNPKETSVTKGCKVRVVSGKHKGVEGKVTKVTEKSAWVQREKDKPFLKRQYNLLVL